MGFKTMGKWLKNPGMLAGTAGLLWLGMCAGVQGQVAPAAKPPAAPGATPAGAQAPLAPGVARHGAATSQGKVSAASAALDESAGAKKSGGVLVDQVIGVVNGDLILESDVDEERRFGSLQPYRNPAGTFSRDAAIDRLIDRALILQQAKLQPDDAVTTEEARAQLQGLRKDIPACKTYGCETDAGWQRYVATQGFTIDELTERWRQRMQILKFIELRFQAGIQISPAQIKDYYEKTMLPEYAKQRVAAPKLETISDRIQEVLLQQQVSNLLADWLKSLKVQGTVRMIRPGEVQP